MLGVSEDRIGQLADTPALSLASPAAATSRDLPRRSPDDVRDRALRAVLEILENDKSAVAKELALRLLRESDPEPIERR